MAGTAVRVCMEPWQGTGGCVEDQLTSGVSAVALIVGFPFLLLGLLISLEKLESWGLRPYERATEVQRLLDGEDQDAIERAVAELLADAADAPAPPRLDPSPPSVTEPDQ